MRNKDAYSIEEYEVFRANFNAWAKREGVALAKLSENMGYRISSMAKIANGRCRINPEHISRMTKALKFDAMKFFRGVPEEKPGKENVKANFTKKVETAEKEKKSQKIAVVKNAGDIPNNIPDEPGRFRYKKALYEKDKNGKIWFIDAYGMHWPCNPAICNSCKWRSGGSARTDRGCNWYTINGNWKLEFKHGYSCDMYEKGRKVKT